MKNLLKKICCPSESCKNNLFYTSEEYLCSSTKCLHSKKGQGYKSINDTPILVCENTCDTIVDPKKTSSIIPRKTSKLRTVWNKIANHNSESKSNLNDFKNLLLKNSHTKEILVIGSGKPGNETEKLWNHKQIKITGIDIYNSPTVDIVADAHYLPFKNQSFDGVIIQAVLEHVLDAPKVVSEIHRILKTTGIVYSEIPFMQQVHEGAYDVARFTVIGHIALFKSFTPLKFGGNKGSNIALTWSIKYFIISVTRSKLIAKIAIIPITFLLLPFSYIISKRSLFDSSSGTFFLGRKSIKKLSHKQIFGFYQGNG